MQLEHTLLQINPQENLVVQLLAQCVNSATCFKVPLSVIHWSSMKCNFMHAIEFEMHSVRYTLTQVLYVLHYLEGSSLI